MQNGVLLDHAGQPYGIACVAIDVTEDRQHRESMEHRVATDPLTGTRNRGAMFEALEELLDPRTGEGCGLLFCDLDDFKGVNDEHGHPVGDRLLIEVAARLRRLAGPEDIVARFGGDEFVILCPHADETTLEALTRRIEDQMSTPLTMPAGPLPIGISIGGAIGRAGDDPDDVITRADGFMYRVKADRRQLRR
jgi:cyclic di-GMP phosphodiesterase Gmr